MSAVKKSGRMPPWAFFPLASFFIAGIGGSCLHVLVFGWGVSRRGTGQTVSSEIVTFERLKNLTREETCFVPVVSV